MPFDLCVSLDNSFLVASLKNTNIEIIDLKQ